MKTYPVCNELKSYLFILTRPGWSEECTEQESSALCAQVLNCLLDVISAFHIGRGGTSMSYMGKGVTKAATLCLRHLVYEMAITMDDKVREIIDIFLYSLKYEYNVPFTSVKWVLVHTVIIPLATEFL